MYVCQYKTYRTIEHSHTVGDVNIIPMLMLRILWYSIEFIEDFDFSIDFNSLFWVSYGYITNTPAVIPINTVGTLFTLFYVILYYSAADSRKRYDTLNALGTSI